MKPVAQNRRAFHQYHVLERLECGLALTGTEVKSLRAGQVQLQEAYAREEGSELYLVGAHIQEYAQGNRQNHDPLRPRKLLVRRRELRKLVEQVSRKGLTLIPLSLYFNDRGLAKVEIGVCQGKKLHDKREQSRAREARREMDRGMARARRER